MNIDSKDGSVVNPDNIIAVTLDDLSEDERREIERQLEEEQAERLRQKLAGYQKTRNGVIKKVVMPSLSSVLNTEVSKPTCSEDIAHLIDVSVASKYASEMNTTARTLTQAVISRLDDFKEQLSKDLESNLPCQVRSMVLQVNDEHQDKWPMFPDNDRSNSLMNATPIVTASTIPTSVSQSLTNDNRSLGFNTNVPQPH